MKQKRVVDGSVADTSRVMFECGCRPARWCLFARAVA